MTSNGKMIQCDGTTETTKHLTFVLRNRRDGKRAQIDRNTLKIGKTKPSLSFF